MKNEESAEQGLQRLRQVFVFSQRVVEMGGEAEIAALRRTEAKEGELDAEFVVEPQLFGVDLARPGPALERLGKWQGGHGAQHSFRTGGSTCRRSHSSQTASPACPYLKAAARSYDTCTSCTAWCKRKATRWR